jgi:hypothetical protein
MNKLFNEFKQIFRDNGPTDDIINMYLVFMGVRSACLIYDVSLFYLMPKDTKLEIYFGRYPGYARRKRDYPLVCLENSLVSRSIQMHNNELTEHELGLYLGFSCFNQDWSNIRINRYSINYSLGNISFYNEVCSIKPTVASIARIKLRAKMMTEALKMINRNYIVRYRIDFLPPIKKPSQNIYE